MFSNNGKISIRQLYRLFLFDFLGLGSLALPTILSRMVGSLGWVCIAAGCLFGLIFLALIEYAQLKNTDKCKTLKRGINIVTAVQSVFACAFCTKVFVDLVRYSLIPDEKYWLVLVVILAVSLYAIKGGLESRARVYEVLFWLVIIPLLIMLAGAVPNMKWERIVVAEAYDGVSISRIPDILKGSYIVFSTFMTLIYVLFLKENVEKSRKKYFYRAVAKALVQNGIILLAVYLILLGNFGAKSLQGMRFPVITLMSTVQIKGTFFKRTDALMMGVWFFTMFAIVNINLFYACRLMYQGICRTDEVKRKVNQSSEYRADGSGQDKTCIQKTRGIIRRINKKQIINICVVLAVFAISLIFNGQEEIMNKYLTVFLHVIVPVLVLIPVMLILVGCNANELENRCFPMLAAVDYDEEAGMVEFFYTFPKSGLNSDNAQETANVAIMPVYDTDFGSARQTYENDLSLDADINHLKVIILGKSFLEREDDYDLMIETLRQEETFPRNTYVAAVDDINHYFELNDSMNNDIGSYIETLLEKKQREEGLELVTIGDLMDDDTDAKENVPVLNMGEIPGDN